MLKHQYQARQIFSLSLFSDIFFIAGNHLFLGIYPEKTVKKGYLI